MSRPETEHEPNDVYLMEVHRRNAEAGLGTSDAVELIGTQWRRVFTSPDELWQTLMLGAERSTVRPGEYS